VSRTPGQFHHPGYQEFLRFFHEGIYGRYFAEGLLVLNSLNLHEGLQLLSSTTVALFVRFGVLRPTIALANCPAPVSLELEQAFYPKASTIARAALATLGDDPDRVGDLAREDHFKGPY
jgi:hypothetical protein